MVKKMNSKGKAAPWITPNPLGKQENNLRRIPLDPTEQKHVVYLRCLNCAGLVLVPFRICLLFFNIEALSV